MDIFSCTVFVLSGRGLCDGPIPRPEKSYRLWCVPECDQVKNHVRSEILTDIHTNMTLCNLVNV
jgi:hypothetical protein